MNTSKTIIMLTVVAISAGLYAGVAHAKTSQEHTALKIDNVRTKLPSPATESGRSFNDVFTKLKEKAARGVHKETVSVSSNDRVHITGGEVKDIKNGDLIVRVHGIVFTVNISESAITTGTGAKAGRISVEDNVMVLGEMDDEDDLTVDAYLVVVPLDRDHQIERLQEQIKKLQEKLQHMQNA